MTTGDLFADHAPADDARIALGEAAFVLRGFALADAPALLAAVIHQAGHSGRREGAYFGLWSWATKMNLALAAGAALPLLGTLGYVPGMRGEHGSLALACTYALLPCAFKLAAGVLLFLSPLRDL